MTGAAQATAYLTNPTRAACGACHNDVNFATGKNHPRGPEFDDKLCSTCHIPQGGFRIACFLGFSVFLMVMPLFCRQKL